MNTTRSQRRSSSTRPAPASAASSNNLPSQDLNAERSVLGAMLLEPEAIDRGAAVVRAEHFYSDVHANVFSTMVAMRGRGEPCDVVTVGSALETTGTLADAGGASGLFDILGTVPHIEHVEHYAKIVVDKYRRRIAVQAGRDLVALGDDLATPTDEALAQAESTLHRAIEGGIDHGPQKIGSVLVNVLDSVDQPDNTVPTGFVALDHLTGGFRPGEMIVIAARPSVGKTALALNIGTALAKTGIGVLVESYEMPSQQLAQRLLVAETGTPWNELRSMKNTLADAANRLNSLPISLDGAGHDASKLIATIRLAARKGIKVALIDYVQLIPPDDPTILREQQVAQVSRKLKQVAISCGITVVALSQLNRQVEARPDPRPKLSDLRESGAIEQDADQVLMLWRPNKGSTDSPDDVARIDVAKNRNGPTGIIDLAWHGPTSTFSNANDRGFPL